MNLSENGLYFRLFIFNEIYIIALFLNHSEFLKNPFKEVKYSNSSNLFYITGFNLIISVDV